MPDNGNQIALAARLHAQHAEALPALWNVTRSTSPASASTGGPRAAAGGEKAAGRGSVAAY